MSTWRRMVPGTRKMRPGAAGQIIDVLLAFTGSPKRHSGPIAGFDPTRSPDGFLPKIFIAQQALGVNLHSCAGPLNLTKSSDCASVEDILRGIEGFGSVRAGTALATALLGGL